jgi:sterol desaturase/sphingolipid hydroxylase (fatty acid hydroxylase superfamily)
MTDLTVTQTLSIGMPIAFLMILLEAGISTWQKKNSYTKKDTLCTIGLLAGNMAAVFMTKGTTLAFHIFLYQFRVFDLAAYIPIWAMWLLSFILIDLVFYFYHRMSHRISFLWAIHMSHHSSQEMNFAVSFRQAWFGPISKVPFFMVLPLLGFDPTIIAVAGALSTLWGIVGHTQMIKSLGPLELILNTPSHHRVHHGANSQYIDKNYGNLLIIWDKFFGTFEPEKEKVKYGLVNNVNTYNPIKITFMAWQDILKKMRHSDNTAQALKYLFGPPNTKQRGGLQ